MPQRFTHPGSEGPEPMDVQGWIGLPDVNRSGPDAQVVPEFLDEPGRALTRPDGSVFAWTPDPGSPVEPVIGVLHQIIGLAFDSSTLKPFPERGLPEAIAEARSTLVPNEDPT